VDSFGFGLECFSGAYLKVAICHAKD
jgi:hypothetical protein